MSALFDVLGTVVKRLFIAALLLGGLLLGLLIALKVLIVVMVLRLVRRFRGPVAKPEAGNVLEGEFSVVKPVTERASVLMVEPPTRAAPTPRAPML